jgi:predicted nucleic acid-binding protein
VTTEIRIEAIDHNSIHLQKVIKLGRKNSNKLGHMPEGGFIEHATKKHILVALSPENECIGYLMYRVAYQRAVIVHLCVDRSYRDKHIAKKLINQLIHITQNLHLIELCCRRDYNLHNMWSSFGFIAESNKEGRSKDGKILTIWQFKHGHSNLLTMLTKEEIGSKLCAVIDKSIFDDLIQKNTDIQIEDSKFLWADWLQSEVELCLTDEIYNQIELNSNFNIVKKQKALANNFKRLSCGQKELESKYQQIIKDFPNTTDNDIYKLRHLARAIASHASFFITHDTEILNKESLIYEKFKISIIRPSDFIIRLDELRKEVEYQPVRLAGTQIAKQIAKLEQIDLLTDAFLSKITGEEVNDFQQSLRSYITNPKQYEVVLIRDDEPEPLALIIYEKEKNNELKIPMLRIRKNYALAPTVLRHLILSSIQKSAQEKCQFTIINEAHLEEFTIEALGQDNFFFVDGTWIRANFATIQTASDLSSYLKNLISGLGNDYRFYLKIANTLADSSTITNVELISGIERILYPAKILDAQIPNFIVPIQPHWAEHLFDENLAQQSIFGARKELALNRENVYYRKVKNSGGLQAPGRILWYVSQGQQGRYCQVKAIKACSILDEIIIDTPKFLFQRFRRLGIYNFENILATANNNPQQKIMAIKFSDTEIFNRPIDFKDIQKILGNSFTFQSPYRIDENKFYTIYNQGIYNK